MPNQTAYGLKADKKPASGRPLLLGITKASLSTDSFLGGELPGDDARSHGGGDQRQDRLPARPEE
jgi:hypothetical protein